MPSRKYSLPAAFVLVAAAVLMFGLSAQGGTRALTFSAASCGSTITSSVTLSSNVDCSGTAATSITIGANGVVVNLNGHTLTGNPSYDCVDNDGYNAVTVTGPGKLVNCADAVYSEYGSGFVTKNLTIYTPSYEGVYYLYQLSSKVSGVTVNDAPDEGIDVEYGASNSVTSNTVTNTGASLSNDYQLYVYYENGSVFTGNTLNFTNQQTSSSTYNIYSDETQQVQFSSNKMSNAYYGLYIDGDDYSGCTIQSNTATNNYGYGFYFTDCYDDYGYYASGAASPTVISGNTATGSADGYGFYDDYNPGASYTNNTAKNNYYGGFYFSDEESDDTITGNVSNGASDGSGFYFYYTGEGYGPKTVSSNSAANNSAYGFEANASQATSYGGIPGSGNATNGNGSGSCAFVAGC